MWDGFPIPPAVPYGGRVQHQAVIIIT